VILNIKNYIYFSKKIEIMMNITSSFFDNIKDKTTNPFFGTLIFVWLVRNWDLVYTVFNFDNNCNLEDKKDFIRSYYVSKVVWQEIGLNILIALGLMVLSYALIIVSRLVVNVTNHNIIPRMNEKTVSKLVVNKDRFETVKKTRDEYFNRIQDFEEQVVTLEQKNTLLKKQNIENKQIIRGLNDKIDKLDNNLEIAESNISVIKSELDNTEQNLSLSKIALKQNEITIRKNSKNLNDFNDLILEYLNKILDTNRLVPYDELNIPTQIKEAYSNLCRESRETENFDLMFFDMAKHLESENRDRVSFNKDYVNAYIDYGLFAKKENEENHNGLGKNLELTILGRIVFNSKDVYDHLKKISII
jgi:hypothetical protein